MEAELEVQIIFARSLGLKRPLYTIHVSPEKQT